jgi:hypothetical protein
VVGVLIRMKLAIIRHSMTGGRAAWMVTGGGVGAALAIATIWLSLVHTANVTVVPDLLATVYLSWMLGWVVGPLWSGSAVLRPDHFTLLSVPARRLAAGLLGAAFVGITTAVTLLAFTSLVTYAARLGVVPALVAAPLAVLQLVVVVLVSRVVATVLGRVATARTGAALNGVLLAGMLVVTQSGWMILVGLWASGFLELGFPTGYSTAMRAVPSGWGLAAVEAADRGAWPLVLGVLAGTLALIAVLLLGWSRTLGTPRSGGVTIRGSRHVAPASRGLFAGSIGAVLHKELRTWLRDPERTMAVVAPLAWALGTALLPLTFGSTDLLPWAAPALALMAATFAVNLYGLDGTALWLTLHTGSERADLRGRQAAYLLVFGPIAAVLAVACTAGSGLTWAWPWVLALTPALLGGGAGLAALISVVALVPGPDAHRRPHNQMEHADVTGPAYLVFFAGALPAVPPAAVVLAGTLLDNDVLRWAGVPAGMVTGVVLGWWLGRIAYHRLQAGGPELLLLMKTGRRTSGPAQVPRPRAAVASFGWILGSIALFPQGLLPMVFKLTGNGDVKVWFLAMYLPGILGWLTAMGMAFIGACLYYLAIKTGTTKKKHDTAPGPAAAHNATTTDPAVRSLPAPMSTERSKVRPQAR